MANSSTLREQTELALRPCEERWFLTYDGTRIFYRGWAPVTSSAGPAPEASPASPGASPAEPRAIVLLHRGHEHSGRLQHLVDELDLPDFFFFAWDARGHGRSPGPRGDSPSIGTSIRDVDNFVEHLCATFGLKTENIAIVAQSVGSVLAAAWVHDYAPKIRALVLAAPAFSVKLYIPFAKEFLRLFYALRGNFFVSSYVKAKFLTHDEERIRTYETDPLITRDISVRILLGLYDTGARLVEDAAAIVVPTQLLTSEKDWVVHLPPQRLFFDRLSSPRKEFHSLPGFFHDTLGEKDRRLALAPLRAFLLAQFATAGYPDSVLPNLRDSHLHGPTFSEHATLSQPLPWWSPKAWNFALTRGFLRTVGCLSDGIRLGVETGFDSGSTLDYVYRNQPSGFSPIGKLIDWFYLNAIGWRGIRIRRAHLQDLLLQAVDRLEKAGEKVRLIDLAAGHGRYVLDVAHRIPAKFASILLRDYSQRNVVDGQRLLDSYQLNAFAKFEQADAFQPDSAPELPPNQNLAVISGFFELFPDNAAVSQVLARLSASMQVGGYLLYTGQPWHPQLEMIARTLTSHRDGRPWVMRRRTQAELDQLVEAAGFAKVRQLTDQWGIFTVSMARKVRP